MRNWTASTEERCNVRGVLDAELYSSQVILQKYGGIREIFLQWKKCSEEGFKTSWKNWTIIRKSWVDYAILFFHEIEKGRGEEENMKKNGENIKTGARKKERQLHRLCAVHRNVFQVNANTSIFYLSEYHEHLFCTSELPKHISELLFSPGLWWAGIAPGYLWSNSNTQFIL